MEKRSSKGLIPGKSHFSIVFFISIFDEIRCILKIRARQREETPKFVQQTQCMHLYPEGGVVWNVSYWTLINSNTTYVAVVVKNKRREKRCPFLQCNRTFSLLEIIRNSHKSML